MKRQKWHQDDLKLDAEFRPDWPTIASLDRHNPVEMHWRQAIITAFLRCDIFFDFDR